MAVKILIANDYPISRISSNLSPKEARYVRLRGRPMARGPNISPVALPSDLVMMDLEIPRMDGLEATRQIKARSTPTKVVLLSALGDEAQSEG